MAGIAQLALGAAPIAGGALLAAAAGQLRGPDFRGALKHDMELLDRIPPDQAERRAELQRTINARIDDLVAAADKSRALRLAANSYEGNWRDIVLFVCAVLFTIIWWKVDHGRSNWLPMLIVMIVVSVLTAAYAARGTVRGIRRSLRRRSS